MAYPDPVILSDSIKKTRQLFQFFQFELLNRFFIIFSTMGLLDYHWKKIGWKRFEEMCVYLAECVWRERRFALFGRDGEEQDGIDILSKTEKGDTVVCIQCKHYETMDLPTVKKIIQKFEEGVFVKTADCFVVATRAALNSREMTRFIESEKERLKESHDIIFETWDGPYIEKELSNHYTLTSNYFGIEIAEMIWSGKSEMPVIYPSVPDFIERSLIPLRDDDSHICRFRINVTPLFRFMLTPSFRSKLTPLYL